MLHEQGSGDGFGQIRSKGLVKSTHWLWGFYIHQHITSKTALGQEGMKTVTQGEDNHERTK